MTRTHPFTGFPPRLIRLRDAPFYVGMDRNQFNKKLRPNLTEIPIGKQGIAFDRLDLDAWVDHHIDRNGRRPKVTKLEDDPCQNETKCLDSASKAGFGKSKNAVKTPKVAGSAKARERLAALRRKGT